MIGRRWFSAGLVFFVGVAISCGRVREVAVGDAGPLWADASILPEFDPGCDTGCLWAEFPKRFVGTPHVQLTAVRATATGGSVVAGRRDILTSRPRAFLAKLDNNGAMAWQKSYSRSGSWWFEAGDVVETEDAGFVAAGSDGTGNVLFKVSSEGDLVWALGIERYSAVHSALLRHSQGGFVLAGPDVTRFDEKGVPVWRNGEIRCFLVSVAEGPDGMLVGAGYFSDSGMADRHACAVGIGADGTLLWARS